MEVQLLRLTPLVRISSLVTANWTYYLLIGLQLYELLSVGQLVSNLTTHADGGRRAVPWRARPPAPRAARPWRPPATGGTWPGRQRCHKVRTATVLNDTRDHSCY